MIDGQKNRVMLINSGIAHWLKQKEKGLLGTMGYAPPELFAGRVEPRSDVYSLGATMFQLLTGVDPQDDPLLLFDFVKSPKPRQITPSISTEMEKILMRSVEHLPQNRFSARELRDALARHLDKLIAEKVPPNSAAFLEEVQVETVYCAFCGGPITSFDGSCLHCGHIRPGGSN
jgi:serine/threonine-protein kinase